MTKDAIRHKVWTRVTAAGVVRFPGAYGRIPNFVGAERAARLLAQLTIWKRAKALKVDLGAPQQALRRAAIRAVANQHDDVGGPQFLAGPALHVGRD